MILRTYIINLSCTFFEYNQYIVKTLTFTIQSEFLQGLIRSSDNQTGNTSSSTWINYRREYNLDENFVSSVGGNSIYIIVYETLNWENYFLIVDSY
jgi:hypothetical protein